MDARTVWKFNPQQGSVEADQLLLFLMTICHQPYSECKAIPLEIALRLVKQFEGFMEELFGRKSTPNRVNSGIPNVEVPK